MTDIDPGLGKNGAALVVGLAVFQLWTAYTTRAPSFSELSHATPGDDTHEQLMDTDLTVGSLAIVAALSLGLLTRDIRLVGLMLFPFIVISLWHHAILNRTYTPER